MVSLTKIFELHKEPGTSVIFNFSDFLIVLAFRNPKILIIFIVCDI